MTELLNTETTEERQYNQWIVFFIFLSVFINSYIFFRYPFEFYFGYIIYIPLLPVFMFKFGLNRNLMFVFAILFLTGLFNIYIGNNTPELFFKVFLGLALSYFFYYYVILEFDLNIEKLFGWYMQGAYIAALIGLIQYVSFVVGFKPGYDFTWILNKWAVIRGGNFGIRVNSIFAEPTYLASTMSAAFFVSIYNVFMKEGFYISRTKSLAIIAVYFLSFSGLGQAGIFITLILLAISFGLIRYIFFAIPAALILFNVLYSNVQDFRDRYDSLTGLFSGETFKLGKTHGSSFILYNNYVVTVENFKTNFMFGGGIGSHPVAFERYSLARNFKVMGFNNNSADANSMLLRLFSETGLFGVSVFLFIVFKYYVRRNPEYDSHHWLISNAILVMILLNLFRQGHYFLNGFPFFVLMYIYNHINYHRALDKAEAQEQPDGEEDLKTIEAE